METTGTAIKQLRKEKGMTQKELASLLGVSYQMVQAWERGARNPKRETLEKIANTLGVSWLALVPKEALNADTVDTFAETNGELAREIMQQLPKETERIMRGLVDTAKDTAATAAVAADIQKVSDIMQTMNDTGRRAAVERVQELAQIPAYQAQPDTGKK